MCVTQMYRHPYCLTCSFYMNLHYTFFSLIPKNISIFQCPNQSFYKQSEQNLLEDRGAKM